MSATARSVNLALQEPRSVLIRQPAGATPTTVESPTLATHYHTPDIHRSAAQIIRPYARSVRKTGLDHLPRLATALSVSTDELLRAPEAGDPRVRGGSHTHHDVTYWPLTRDGPAGGLRAYKIRVNPRRRLPPAELPVHEGQDWIYVLSGRMRLILGEKDFTIKPGEAVEFSTWTPHWFGAVDGPVEAITLFWTHRERLHLHN